MFNKKLQNIVNKARKEWGFADEDLLLLLCNLTGEIGELNTCIRNQYVYNKPAIPENDKSSLKHEMADVLIFLYAVANKCNIDLDKAVLSKIKLNNKRFNQKKDN